ncbi:MAG: toxic anion resistance protein [Chloroflexi bacterium]|nr:toxic anion resistance protein [Chloroflexota bacterium]
MAQEINLAELAASKARFEPVKEEKMEIQPIAPDREFTNDELAKIEELKNNINLLNSQGLLIYGVGAQRKITDFADSILKKVQAKDAGNVGEVMTDLLVTVQSLDIDSLSEKETIFSKLPFMNNLKRFMAKYQTIEGQIDKIELSLDQSRNMLLKDIGMFDMLYQKNVEYFHELDYLIVAGEEKIKEAREEVLPKLTEEARQKNDPMSIQLVHDFEDTINRFEKKVHDLKLSKTIAMQTAPQIRLIQNNDKALVDKIQTAILNTIPLWKNQIVIALGLQNQDDVLKMQRKINQTTNDLLLKNAEMLKQNTIEVAKESEKGIVELDTLKKVNTDLIETIEETMKIHKEGRAARQNAELELAAIESRLKDTLLQTGK